MGSTDALDPLHRQRPAGTGLHGDATDPGGSMRMTRKENVITMIDWLASCKMRWGALGMRGCFGRAAHGMVHVLAPTARSSYTRPMASGRQRLLHAPYGLQRRHAGARRQVRISISKNPCRPCILRVSVSAMRAKKTALIGFSNEAIGRRRHSQRRWGIRPVRTRGYKGPWLHDGPASWSHKNVFTPSKGFPVVVALTGFARRCRRLRCGRLRG